MRLKRLRGLSLFGLGLMLSLSACAGGSTFSQQASQIRQLQANPNAEGGFKAPTGTLRHYQAAQARALAAPKPRSITGLNTSEIGISPILSPELPPEVVVPNPNAPPGQILPGEPNGDPYQPPTVPGDIGNIPQDGGPNLPGNQPNAPGGVNGSPNGTPPGGNYRYADLQWFLRKIEAPRAWQVTQGNSELKVAVIDTGVDYGHPAFRGRMLKGYNFADQNLDPMDDQAHGTHVAGIIAGNDGNIRGVAPNVQIMAIKVFSRDGFAQGEHVLARAIHYAVRYGASVINLSLGSPTLYDCSQYSEYIRSLNSAIDEAQANGVTVITAAGNEAYDFIYGRCSVQQNVNQTPVVATTEMDRLAPFSNYPNFSHPKAVSAPGVNIFSAIPRHLVCDDQRCEMPYDYMDGTSMAAPVIAGAMALVRSAMYDDYVRVIRSRVSRGVMQGPILSFRGFFHEESQLARQQLSVSIPPAQLAERIVFAFTNQDSRVDPPGLIYEGRRDPIFGFGRINVGAAVEAASRVFTAARL